MTTAITFRSRVSNNSQSGRGMNIFLWTLQSLLAALFLFAGVMKLIMPVEMMTKQIPLPAAFLHFIGMAEALGAVGLVLPWGLRIRQELTPLAATGLIVIMAGATTVTFRIAGWAQALMPFVVGCLLVTVACGRWSSLRDSARAQIRQSTGAS